MKGSIEKIMNLIYYLQLTKAITLYEVPYPSNAVIYLNETRRLIDFESLKPDNFI
jgi:hypothetical protein